MNEPVKEIEMNSDILLILDKVRKWTLFLSIAGFTGILIMIILAFSVSPVIEYSQQPMPVPAYIFTLFYLLLAAVSFFPVLYLYHFSVRMKKAIQGSSSALLLSAFSSLKTHYKFTGILLIIILAVYVLAFIVGIAGGAMVFN